MYFFFGGIANKHHKFGIFVRQFYYSDEEAH